MVRIMADEKRLWAKIAEPSTNVEDYLELASLLFQEQRFDESVETLRRALSIPFDNLARANLLTALAWYTYGAYGTRAEPLSLGRQALGLTEGIHGVEASVA